MSEQKRPELTAPAWQPGTRLAAAMLLLVLAGVVIYRLRSLLPPLILSGLLAFVLHPVVTGLAERTRLSRRGAVAVVYFSLLLLMAGATTGIGLAISQQLGTLIRDLRLLSLDLPAYLEKLNQLQISIGPWTWDLAQINLDPLLEGLGTAIQPLLSQTGTLLGSIAGTTASTIATMLAVMVLGYYLLLDFGKVGPSVLGLVPKPYHQDFRRLALETGRVWGAFLRGQLILSLVVGAMVALVMGALGVRLALVLGLIAGLLEFVPIFGPAIAGLIAAIVALFQGEVWWGGSTLWLVSAVVLAFIIIQQIENNILVPRILGESLNLHPMIVMLAALAGGTLAGVIGLLLAGPTVATLRLWVGYVYAQTTGLRSWPAPVLVSPQPSGRRRPGWRFRRWLRSRRAKKENPPSEPAP